MSIFSPLIMVSLLCTAETEAVPTKRYNPKTGFQCAGLGLWHFLTWPLLLVCILWPAIVGTPPHRNWKTFLKWDS